MKLFLASALAALLCGCTTKTGRVYPIIGLGWVVVNTNQPNVVTVKTTLLGAGVNTLPPEGMVGFSQTRTTLISTNSNVILDIK